MVTLTDEDAKVVRSVLTDLIQAMTDAGLTIGPIGSGSGSLMWTATDEWVARYLKAMRLLQPGAQDVS